jgi:hypothetical protein
MNVHAHVERLGLKLRLPWLVGIATALTAAGSAWGVIHIAEGQSRLEFRAHLRLGGGAVFHVLLCRSLLQHFEPCQLEARGDIRVLHETGLLGVLGDELDADEVFLDLFTILG